MYKSILYRGQFLRHMLTFVLVCVFTSMGQAHQGESFVIGNTPFSHIDNPFEPVSEHLRYAEKDNKYTSKPDKKDWKRRYEAMTPAERKKLEKRREYFKSLPPEERQRIHQAREKFRNLPPEKREALKEQWRNMSPEQRKEFHKKFDRDGNFPGKNRN